MQSAAPVTLPGTEGDDLEAGGPLLETSGASSSNSLLRSKEQQREAEAQFAALAAECEGLPPPLVLFLVGKMGTGKSSLGNCLLGQNNFEAKRSARAVTAKLTVGSTCATLREQLRHHQQQQRGDSCTAAAHTSDVDAVSTTPAASVVPPPPFSPWSAQAPVPQQQQQPQRPLVVVDSPGFGDPSRSTTALLNEIKVLADQCAAALQPSRASFCIVLVLGCHARVSNEDIDTVRNLYSVFGTAFLRKSVVVFTHADLLDSSDSAGMLSGGAHITGGLGGSQEDDEATAASSAAAVRKLTSDDRLAGFLQGASEEVLTLLGTVNGGAVAVDTMKWASGNEEDPGRGAIGEGSSSMPTATALPEMVGALPRPTMPGGSTSGVEAGTKTAANEAASPDLAVLTHPGSIQDNTNGTANGATSRTSSSSTSSSSSATLTVLAPAPVSAPTAAQVVIQAAAAVAGPLPVPRGKVARRLRQAANKAADSAQAAEEAAAAAAAAAARGEEPTAGWGCVIS